MDRKHKLNAPDNDSLQFIEQVNDHSELSTLYPHAHDQWTGEIMTEEARLKKRDKEHEEITTKIIWKFWLIGVLAPIPIILAAIITVLAFLYINPEQMATFIVPALIALLVWAGASYFAIRRIFLVFYNHALRAGPFLVTLLVMLGLSVQTIYVLTLPLHNQSPIHAVTLISGIILLWSILLSLLLLWIWVTPYLRGNGKFSLLAILAVILIAVSGIVTLIY